MLDQHDRQPLLVERGDEAGKLGGLGIVHPGGGLVEDQEVGLHRQGAGDF